MKFPNRRFGILEIPEDDLFNPMIIQPIMCNIVVTKAEFDYMINRARYWCWSRLFEESELGEIAPTYDYYTYPNREVRFIRRD